MLGYIFALLSSASFGLNNAAIRRGVLSGSPGQALYLTVILGVPLFVIASAVSGQLFHIFDLPLRGYLLLLAAGVLHFFFGRYCNYRAISAIGANRTNPILAMALPYSVLVAVLALGEKVTPLMGLGILLILIGPAIIVERRSQPRPVSSLEPGNPHPRPSGSPPAGGSDGAPTAQVSANPRPIATQSQEVAVPFVLRQAEGYLYGTLAAITYGTSPILIRSALKGTDLGILGGLVSYSAAAGILLISLLLPGRLASLQAIKMTAMRWFLLATVMVFLAQMFKFIALSMAPVTIVAPLQRASSVFALIFSFLINRRVESFGPRVILGIALSAAGAVLLIF